MIGPSRARLIVVPLLVCACQSWHTVPITPGTSGRLPEHSTVVLMGGRRVDVDGGYTTRDSLIADRNGGWRFAVHRDSVAFVETRKVNVVRSVAAGAGGLVVAVSVLAVLALAALLSDFQ